MSKIEEFFAIDETIEYYKKHKEAAIALAEQAGVHVDYFSEEESRKDALDLACAIIALAQ